MAKPLMHKRNIFAINRSTVLRNKVSKASIFVYQQHSSLVTSHELTPEHLTPAVVRMRLQRTELENDIGRSPTWSCGERPDCRQYCSLFILARRENC